MKHEHDSEQVISTVEYEAFRQDPVAAVRLSAETPVAVVDKNGKRRMFFGRLSDDQTY
jgi:hypothetical protein